MLKLLAKLAKLKKYKELIAMITAVLAIGGELAVALLGDICTNFVNGQMDQMDKLHLIGNARTEREILTMDIYTCCNMDREFYKTNYRWNEDASQCLPTSSNS
jgi:hypothetical protein